MITDIAKLKKDLIYIQNRKTFLVEVPQIHPDSPKYDKLWTEYTRYCIEGLWGFDNGGWRFMPPTLFFYGNFFKIVVTNEDNKVRMTDNPEVRDIDWHIHYAYMEAQGFSGWVNDDVYTSDYIIFDEKKLKDLAKGTTPAKQKRYLNLVNKKGELKKFLHPRVNLRMLHTEKRGKALYHNAAKNVIVFGSRGGGKSFTTAGIMGQILTFDGLKYFTTETFNNPPKVSICVGAAISDNSSELCSKLVDGLNCYGTEKSLGVWGSYEDDDYTPNPFYRDWVGSINSGNKKNPFRYSYKVQTKAGWITKGTGTSLLHVNYSDKKQGGAQAAAGGRYLFSVMEEIGLQANFVDSLLSNTATVSDKGGQFGVQWAIGTSGNIDLVQQSKKAFTNPGEYNFLEFDDIWEGSGKIGLFMPAYLTDVSFKDENGNTKLEDVLEHYAKRRAEANNANDPEVLRNEKMNYPLVPSDMWITSKGHYFPIMECLDREKVLLKNRLYETIGTAKKLIWDSKALNGVKAEYDPDAEPFYDFPYDRSMSTIDGTIMIYEEPNIVKGEVPDDMYIATLDPYVAENVEDGGSLGALMVFLNPKYTKDGFNGNYLVCTYIGKHSNGKDAFYENVEKVLAYYGNPPRGLWYEANRGEAVRGYFMRKKKMHLLAIRPNKEKGSSAVDRRVLEYGYVVGNKVALLDMIGNTYEWLLSKTMHDGVEKRVIETFPCIFTIRQMINFHFDKHSNFDAVSSVLGYPLALKEIEHQVVEETSKKGKHNPLTFLSMNPYLFKSGREMVDRHNRMKNLLNEV